MFTADYVQKLREALQEVEREIADIEGQLRTMRSHATQLRGMIDGIAPSATHLDDRDALREEPAGSPVGDKRAYPTKAVRNTIFEILRETDSPLHGREITDRLALRGYNVGGRDPYGTVRSHLSHDPRFVPVGQGRWDLASRQRRNEMLALSRAHVEATEPIVERANGVLDRATGATSPATRASEVMQRAMISVPAVTQRPPWVSGPSEPERERQVEEDGEAMMG